MSPQKIFHRYYNPCNPGPLRDPLNLLFSSGRNLARAIHSTICHFRSTISLSYYNLTKRLIHLENIFANPSPIFPLHHVKRSQFLKVIAVHLTSSLNSPRTSIDCKRSEIILLETG